MAFSGSGASSGDLDAVLRQPGRFVANPSDLSAAFPYGGTYLGRAARGCTTDIDMRVTPLVCTDEQGPEPYDELFVGLGEISVLAELTEWNTDALQLAFPAMTASATGERLVTLPGTLVPGLLLSSEALTTLLYAPYNASEHRSVLLRKVTYHLEGPIPMRDLAETRVAVRFRIHRDTSKADAQERTVIGLLSNLTL
jgi:hypothetical protein